jgi:hypothetical protein
MLLFAVSAQRQLSWQAFAHVLNAIFVADERIALDIKHVRSAVASLGDALGHWEVVADGSSARICIAPPVLASLPRPGLPTAVLCGARSPDTLPSLSQACGNAGVELRIFGESGVNPYAPSRFELVAQSLDALADVAESLHVPFASEPAAWRLAIACGSLEDYIGSLTWSSDPDLNWPRRDFDPEGLRFTRPVGNADRARVSLSAYVHPSGWARQDRLWREREYTSVDRDWGRYAVLADSGHKILRFDRVSGLVAVPRQVPLPRIAARSLALCSGRPPMIHPGDGLGLHVYSAVPESVFGVLAAKLGQDGHPIETAEVVV